MDLQGRAIVLARHLQDENIIKTDALDQLNKFLDHDTSVEFESLCICKGRKM